MGDAMQFVRYAPWVKARGGTVWLECPPELVPLFSRCAGVDRALPGGVGLPPFDLQIPLMSLPAVFDTRWESVPAEIPYLSAEPAHVEKWKERLARVEGLRVGVVWQGNPRFGWDHFRSFPLAALAPLAEVAGVRLVSLQKGPGLEQLRAARARRRRWGSVASATRLACALGKEQCSTWVTSWTPTAPSSIRRQ
jgi:hypothetical protein